jgi:uncharacterized protein YegP (UPF0339 family)
MMTPGQKLHEGIVVTVTEAGVLVGRLAGENELAPPPGHTLFILAGMRVFLSQDQAPIAEKDLHPLGGPQTARKPRKPRKPKRTATVSTGRSHFELYQDSKGEWRWRLVAANGRTVADSGEGYAAKAGAEAGIALVTSLTMRTRTLVR